MAGRYGGLPDTLDRLRIGTPTTTPTAPGDLDVESDITVGGNLTVTGNITPTGNIIIGGSLGVTGTLAVTGRSALSHVYAANNAGFSNTVHVVGRAIFSNAVEFSGMAYASGGVTVTGGAVFNNGIILSGAPTPVAQTVAFGDEVDARAPGAGRGMIAVPGGKNLSSEAWLKVYSGTTPYWVALFSGLYSGA